MKKAVSFLGALAILLSAVSCTKTESSEPSPQVVNEAVTMSFKEAKITMAEDFGKVISLDKLGEQVMLFGIDSRGEYTGYVTDSTFDEHTAFTYSPASDETVKSACLCKFGKTAVLTLQGERLMLRLFNRDGELCNEYDLGEHRFDTEMGAIIMANGEDYIINLNNDTILSVLSDGTVVGEVNCKGGIIYGVTKDNEDAPTVILGYGDETKVANISGVGLENERKCTELSSSPYALCGGCGEYSLVGNFNDGLYGLQGESWVKLTDYMDNTFGSMDIYGLISIGEKEIAAMTTKGFILLSERDISEIKAKKVITVASWEDSRISDDIKRFNSMNGDYRVELKSFGSSKNMVYEERMAMLREAVLSGNTPDILVNDRSTVTAESFGARESLFVDIYDLIDSDPTMDRGDFVDGYLDALSFNGKLLSFAPGFVVDTMAVKDKFLGGLTSWDLPQMMDVIKNRPEGTGIITMDNALRRAEYMLKLMDYGSFVDFEKAECHFDSAEFINAMKAVQENELGKTEAEYESFLQNGDDEWDDYPSSRYYMDDKYLIRNSMPYVSSMHVLHEIVSAEFNEPVTFIGYPSYDGIGTKMQPDEYRTFSILRSCQDPEGAWEFIRDTYLTDDFYNSYQGAAYFPALESSFAAKADAETKPRTDEDGNNAYTYYFDGTETLEYSPFTADEAQKYSGMIREAAHHKRRYDNTIFNILLEELTPYFEGERTAEEAAQVIQNRTSIYVSENYG